MKLDITIERIKHSGALLLTTIHNGRFRKRTYYGYSQREAKRLFREYVLTEEN
jgi:hypothetical protein